MPSIPSSEDIILDEFAIWVMSGDCLFARDVYRIDKDKEQDGRVVFQIVQDNISDEDLELLQSEIVFATESDKTQAIQIIFTNVNTSEEVVNLILKLCKLEGWYCFEQPPKKSQIQDEAFNENMMYVALRWVYPDNQHVTQVMGTIHLDTMPPYRRSKYTSLVFAICEPGPTVQIATGKPRKKLFEITKSGEERLTINLSDMTPFFVADSTAPVDAEQKDKARNTRNYWVATRSLFSNKSVQHPDVRFAPNGFTFALPSELRDKIAPALSEIAIVENS